MNVICKHKYKRISTLPSHRLLAAIDYKVYKVEQRPVPSRSFLSEIHFGSFDRAGMRSFRGLAQPRREDPTYTLPSALRDAFLKHVHDGNIVQMKEMLEKEPLLAQVRDTTRATALLLASVHPDTKKAVEMIDFLMQMIEK